MNNIVKCPVCKKCLIEEEFDQHICMPNPKFERIVDVFYKNFFSIIVDGKDVAVVLADDGTLYRIKPPKKKHPFRTPDKETEYIYVHCRLERVSLLGVQFWVVN